MGDFGDRCVAACWLVRGNELGFHWRALVTPGAFRRAA